MANSAGRRRRSAFAAGLATMAMAVGLAAVPAQAASPPPRADYVALGDSYTAGTGAGPFATPLPCLQSHPGYVDVVGATGRVALVANAACHGALLNSTAPGGVPSVALQIGGLAGVGSLSAGTELVSITAGANDVGFNTVLLTCAYQPPQNCAAALQASKDALVPLRQGLAATYWTVRQAAPTAKIAVLGYPRLFDPAVGVAGINPAILAALNQATDDLNAAISGAVADANVGAQFIGVTGRFTGHAANSADPWIVLDLANPLAPQNFHPNAAGHSLGYAAALMGAVKPAQLARR